MSDDKATARTSAPAPGASSALTSASSPPSTPPSGLAASAPAATTPAGKPAAEAAADEVFSAEIAAEHKAIDEAAKKAHTAIDARVRPLTKNEIQAQKDAAKAPGAPLNAGMQGARQQHAALMKASGQAPVVEAASAPAAAEKGSK